MGQSTAGIAAGTLAMCFLLPPLLKKVPKVGEAVDHALEQAGVADARRRIIGQLSKGYRQRVGLAPTVIEVSSVSLNGCAQRKLSEELYAS